MRESGVQANPHIREALTMATKKKPAKKGKKVGKKKTAKKAAKRTKKK